MIMYIYIYIYIDIVGRNLNHPGEPLGELPEAPLRSPGLTRNLLMKLHWLVVKSTPLKNMSLSFAMTIPNVKLIYIYIHYMYIHVYTYKENSVMKKFQI